MKIALNINLKRRCFFYLVVFILSFQTPARAESPTDSGQSTGKDSVDINIDVESALSAYDTGDFAAAAKGFEQAWASGSHNGSLLFNLGNAHFKNNARGAAVAAYLAARDFLPRDAELLANLQYVLNENQDNLPVQLRKSELEKTLFFWLDSFSLSEAYWMFVTVLFFFFVASTLCLYLKAKVVHRYVLLVSSALVILFATMLANRLYFSPTWGAVIAPRASLYSSPTMTSAVLFRLHEGAPVVLKQRQGDWIQLEFGDAKKAWIAAGEVRFYISKSE
ncbi:MAG: hypothetical protein KBD78_12465 [Oligoflexales bacterium]|nr:hypothetical protein [Oligoflexales bacterium]